jgi:hypothetical protein
MPVCPHCGEAIAADAEECPSCGSLVNDLLETRPFHPSFEQRAEPAGDLGDTERRLPVIDGPLLDEPTDTTEEEDEDDLRSTLVDGKDGPEPQNLAATLVDEPPKLEMGDVIASGDLGDTLLEIQSKAEDPTAPITFSDVPVKGALTPDGTGAAPLNFQEFESTKDRGRRETKDSGQEESVPDPREKRPAPGTRLPRVLAWLTAVAWVALAILLVAGYLNVPLVVGLLALLPFEIVALTAVPAALQLVTLIAAARTNHRIDGAMLRSSSFVRHFLRLLLWVVLATLPGVGLLLGLFGALRLILRRPPNQDASGLATNTAAYSDFDFAADRSVGWMLVFYTLAWQEEVLVIVLTYFRAYLPW